MNKNTETRVFIRNLMVGEWFRFQNDGESYYHEVTRRNNDGTSGLTLVEYRTVNYFGDVLDRGSRVHKPSLTTVIRIDA